MRKDYDVAIGQDFEIIEAKIKHNKEITRGRLAMLFVIASLLATALAFWIGGADAALRVWGLIAVPIGVIINHYFRG